MTRTGHAAMIDRTGQFPEGIGKDQPSTIAQQLEARRGTMGLSEFADLMTVSYKTVYKWVREAGLPATKITGTYWIDPTEAACWWREQSTTFAKRPAVVAGNDARIAGRGVTTPQPVRQHRNRKRPPMSTTASAARAGAGAATMAEF